MEDLEKTEKKAYYMITASGPMVVLTSYNSIINPELLERIQAKGINKFIAYELPIEEVKAKYGGHYNIVLRDLHQTDDFRVLDYNGERAFRLFSLKQLGTPIYFEEEEEKYAVT